VKVLSPRPAYNTTKFNEFSTRIEEICDYYPSIYAASAYDACWLYAYSIIETGSMNVTSIKEVLPEVSNGYIGVSGDCTMNAAGDKNDSDYRIRGFIRTHIDEAEFTDYGYYDSGNDTITWLIDPGIEAAP
jgi:ABC-type branched-subunit amino acid transport system substrate-binding protein